MGVLSAGQLPLSAGQLPLSVGQLAARAGVRPDTIRYYERSGVLPPPRRSDGDHRRYGPADVDRLLFIKGAQRLGLRLTEIRELLTVRDTGACPCEPAGQMLSKHVAEIDSEMARLAVLRAELITMLAGLQAGIRAVGRAGIQAGAPPGIRAGMQVGSCGPDPVPGTWCRASLDREP
jgi:DNA-binding transcriptional MerR regulator